MEKEPEVPQEGTQEEKHFEYKEDATEEEKRKTIEKRYSDLQGYTQKRFDKVNEAIEQLGTRLSSLDSYDEKLNKLSESFSNLNKMLDPNEPKKPQPPQTDDPDALYEYQQKLKQFENAQSLKEQKELKQELTELKKQIEEKAKREEQEKKLKDARNSVLGNLQKAGATPEESVVAYDIFIENYHKLSADDVLEMTRAYRNRVQQKQNAPRKEKENPPPPPSPTGGHVDSLSSEEKWKQRWKK